MANQENLQKVMDKIIKLKRLYEGAKKINSEGEAAAAAAGIQRLLEKYNLSMDEIQEQTEENGIMHEEISGYSFKSIGGTWEMKLTTVLCENNFCQCYMFGNSYKRLVIIGKKENIEVVKWLRDMLSERYVQFSKEKFKEYKNSPEFGCNPMSKDKYQRSYLLGCCLGLEAKLKEEKENERRKDEEYSSKVTSLAIRYNSDILDYIKKTWGGTRTVEKHNRGDENAMKEGYTDGKNTDIYKPISDNRKNNASQVKFLG